MSPCISQESGLQWVAGIGQCTRGAMPKAVILERVRQISGDTSRGQVEGAEWHEGQRRGSCAAMSRGGCSSTSRPALGSRDLCQLVSSRRGFGVCRAQRLDASWGIRLGNLGKHSNMSERSDSGSGSRRKDSLSKHSNMSGRSLSGSGLRRKESLGTRWSRKFTSKARPAEAEAEVEGEEEGEVEAEMKGVEEQVSGAQLTLRGSNPEHLIVFVNGIWGSVKNWIFAATEFERELGDKALIHCSTSNGGLKTHAGVDVMGKRLAEEVMDLVKKNPDVTKISFISHSLGGLISRYAIGLLYAPKESVSSRLMLQEWADAPTSDSEAGGSGRARIGAPFVTQEQGTIAGLEPINFITLATPHLGCRGNNHLPFLFGRAVLEWAAPHVSPFFIGPTGRHLFLADGNNDREPLLQRMVSDNDEGKFLSALRCFKRRVAYANVTHDRMVGWRTASIRKAHEMPEPLLEPKEDQKALCKYKYIVRVEQVPLATDSSEPKDAAALDSIEEAMVASLQQLSWVRVDVNFSKVDSLYEAHNLIQVKRPPGEGKYIFEHIIDSYFR